jgi:hypothetical protein
LPVADVSASESKKITVTGFIGQAITLVADATIPSGKLLFSDGSIPSGALANGAATEAKIASGAVSGSKLGENSTVNIVATLPATGAYIGQIGLESGQNKGYVWNGSQWVAFRAAKLTSGTLLASVIGANTVTGNKLANSSVTQFGGTASTEGIVTFPTADFTGQYFFDSINGDLYLWDGNAWQPITITAGEIVFAGTYNATTNLVASVTTAGTAAGLTAGSALPAAAAANNRYYLVVSVGGTGTAPAPTVALAPPDMLLSNGAAWQEIDVSGTVAAQVASNISFTPAGAIAATNVQTALVELDNEKLAVAGGTVTGELSLTNTIVNADINSAAAIAYSKLSLAGTIVNNDIASGAAIAYSKLALTGSVVNADIGAAAAIADTKLATISTAGKVSPPAERIRGTTDARDASYHVSLPVSLHQPHAASHALSEWQFILNVHHVIPSRDLRHLGAGEQCLRLSHSLPERMQRHGHLAHRVDRQTRPLVIRNRPLPAILDNTKRLPLVFVFPDHWIRLGMPGSLGQFVHPLEPAQADVHPRPDHVRLVGHDRLVQIRHCRCPPRSDIGADQLNQPINPPDLIHLTRRPIKRRQRNVARDAFP